MKSMISMAMILACSGCGKQPEKQSEKQISSDLSPREKNPEDVLQEFIRQSAEFTSISFTQLIGIASGRKVIPVDCTASPDNTILDSLATALDKSLAELNQDNSPVRRLRRINEASRFFED